MPFGRAELGELDLPYNKAPGKPGRLLQSSDQAIDLEVDQAGLDQRI